MVAVDHANGNTAPGVVTLLLGEAEQKVGDLSYRAADRWGDQFPPHCRKCCKKPITQRQAAPPDQPAGSALADCPM